MPYPGIWPKVKIRLRMLYPLPTVWSSHPLISLSDKGAELGALFVTEQFQKLAWESHGFRSAVPGVLNDPSVFGIAGIAREIEQVMPMPSAQVMESILSAIDTSQ